MGVKTLYEYFYKLAYGDKGVDKATLVNDCLDVADAQIKANKPVDGEWTPALKFGGASVNMTYTTQAGLSTKIGRVVILTANILLSAKGTSTGAATITGLPSASKDADGATSAVTLRMNKVSFANVSQAYIQKNTSHIVLIEITEGGTVTNLTEGNFANDTRIMISATYFTD